MAEPLRKDLHHPSPAGDGIFLVPDGWPHGKESVQNAVKNSINPSPVIRLQSVPVLGAEVIAILVPPWNRRDVYQYEGRTYVRKGTNVFQATVDEVKRLHKGQTMV